MAFLEWTPELSVGDEEIDSQHRRLVALVNQLHDAMVAGEVEQRLGEFLVELVEYTKYHFSTEERLFEERSYPGRDEHVAQHQEFVGRLLEYIEAHNEGNASISVGMLQYLREWVLHHIREVDRQYAPFLFGDPVG